MVHSARMRHARRAEPKHHSAASSKSLVMKKFGDSSASQMSNEKERMWVTTKITTTQNGPGTAKNRSK